MEESTEKSLSLPADEPAYWIERWREGRTGWDLNGPHPMLKELMETVDRMVPLAPQSRIWVPGAGRAHDAAALAKTHLVDATDVAEQAVNDAKSLYGHVKNLTIHVGNALETPEDEVGVYDAIFDRAMLCALPTMNRLKYVRSCYERLKPQGLFLTLAFSKTKAEPGNPPFGIPIPELLKVLADFSLVDGREYLADEAYGKDRVGAVEREFIGIFLKTR